MRVDLRGQSTGRSRLRLTCQATVPALIILVTLVGCSRPTANMPEPSYRVALPVLPFFSHATDGENQQVGPRRFDERSIHQAEQHKIQGYKGTCAGCGHRTCFASCSAKGRHATATRSRDRTNGSSDFWNGGAVRKTFRNEPGGSPGIKTLRKNAAVTV